MRTSVYSFISLLQLFCAGTLSMLTTDCPDYVGEGKTLDCTCTGTCAGNQSPSSITWQNSSTVVSRTANLMRHNVSRQDNGTEFTCNMTCKGGQESAVYVLKVYYGPSSDSLTIAVSGSRVVGANTSLTLTCLATDVYPEPVYYWFGEPCVNATGNTCSFVPQCNDDSRTVVCRSESTDPLSSALAVKQSTLDLMYPPAEPPVVAGYTPSQSLESADNLSCTVRGGKPLVHTVHFYCDGHPDQPDSRTQSAVTSVVTFDPSAVTTDNVTCVCSADWQPRPDLYIQNITISVNVDLTSTKAAAKSETMKLPIWTIAVIAVGSALLVVVAGFIAVCLCRRKTKSKEKKEKERSERQGTRNPCIEAYSEVKDSRLKERLETEDPSPYAVGDVAGSVSVKDSVASAAYSEGSGYSDIGSNQGNYDHLDLGNKSVATQPEASYSRTAGVKLTITTKPYLRSDEYTEVTGRPGGDRLNMAPMTQFREGKNVPRRNQHGIAAAVGGHSPADSKSTNKLAKSPQLAGLKLQASARDSVDSGGYARVKDIASIEVSKPRAFQSAASSFPRVDSCGYAVAEEFMSPAQRPKATGTYVYDNLHNKQPMPSDHSGRSEYDHLSGLQT